LAGARGGEENADAGSEARRVCLCEEERGEWEAENAGSEEMRISVR
jgi:hypothetical protein